MRICAVSQLPDDMMLRRMAARAMKVFIPTSPNQSLHDQISAFPQGLEPIRIFRRSACLHAAEPPTSKHDADWDIVSLKRYRVGRECVRVSHRGSYLEETCNIEHGEGNMNSIKSMIGSGLLVAGLLTSAGSALAAGSDDGFAAFWTQFKAAASKSHQKAISQMIKFPVFYNDPRQVVDFPVIWKGAFKTAQQRCLTKQKPGKEIQEGKVVYSAFCGDLIYYLSKDNAGWKLTEFGVND
jgi:hypothetical protein